MPKIVRRLGTPPTRRGSLTGQSCPELLELSDGRIAFMGTTLSPQEIAELGLPDDARIAPGDSVVVLTRLTLMHALADVPAEEPAACDGPDGCPHISVQPNGWLLVVGRTAADGEVAASTASVGHGEEAVTVPPAVWQGWLAGHLAREQAAAGLAADAGAVP